MTIYDMAKDIATERDRKTAEASEKLRAEINRCEIELGNMRIAVLSALRPLEDQPAKNGSIRLKGVNGGGSTFAELFFVDRNGGYSFVRFEGAVFNGRRGSELDTFVEPRITAHFRNKSVPNVTELVVVNSIEGLHAFYRSLAEQLAAWL